MNINLATKAALLSALLFPGWGQFFLKKYKRGLAIMILVMSAVVCLCWYILLVALEFLKSAPLKQGEVNFSSVIRLTADTIKTLNAFYLSLIILFIILLWIYSVVEAYLLGKKEMMRITTAAHQ